MKTLMNGTYMKFSGQDDDWFVFAQRFFDSVHMLRIPVIHKCDILYNAIQNAVLESRTPGNKLKGLRTLLEITGTENYRYQFMLENLELLFGNLNTHVDRLLDKLKSTRIRYDNAQDFLDFQQRLTAYISANERWQQQRPHPDTMHEVYTRLYACLPAIYQNNFREYSRQVQTSNIYTLRDWCAVQVQSLCQLNVERIRDGNGNNGNGRRHFTYQTNEYDEAEITETPDFENTEVLAIGSDEKANEPKEEEFDEELVVYEHVLFVSKAGSLHKLGDDKSDKSKDGTSAKKKTWPPKDLTCPCGKQTQVSESVSEVR